MTHVVGPADLALSWLQFDLPEQVTEQKCRAIGSPCQHLLRPGKTLIDPLDGRPNGARLEGSGGPCRSLPVVGRASGPLRGGPGDACRPGRPASTGVLRAIAISHFDNTEIIDVVPQATGPHTLVILAPRFLGFKRERVGIAVSRFDTDTAP